MSNMPSAMYPKLHSTWLMFFRSSSQTRCKSFDLKTVLQAGRHFLDAHNPSWAAVLEFPLRENSRWPSAFAGSEGAQALVKGNAPPKDAADAA